MKAFAVAGNALVAAGLALLGVAPSYACVLVAAFLMGVGAGTLEMVLSPIVAMLRSHRRAAAMNWLHSFYCIGAVVTVLVASWALEAGVHWRRLAWGLLAMPCAVAAAFAFVAVPQRDGARPPHARLGALAREPFFLLALVAIFLSGATELGMAQWLPAYAELTLEYPKWVGGMALMGFSLAMAVGRIAAGALGARLETITLMRWGGAASVALYLLGSLLPHPGAALAACIAVGLSASVLWPSVLAITSDRFGGGAPSMFGLLAAMGCLGGIVMPWTVGALSDAASMRAGLASAAVCPLVLIGVLVALGAHHPKK
jgi:fucose permease